MTFEEAIQAVLLGLFAVALGLFTAERWFFRDVSERQIGTRAIFGSPILRLAAIILLVLITVGKYESNTGYVVVGTIAATVAGADFVLLLVALIRGDKDFVSQYFQTERLRIETVQTSADAWLRAVAERTPTEKKPAAPSRKQIVAAFREMPSHAAILWVDDSPAGNRTEMFAFRNLGMEIQITTTNKEAVDAVASRSFDLIISDIGRRPPEDERAGLELPAALLKVTKSLPPIIYYVGTVDRPYTDAGYPVVSTPGELLAAVRGALGTQDPK